MERSPGGRPPQDHVVPAVTDRSGYAVRHRDLTFLEIDDTELAAWRERKRLLGMSQNQYDGFLGDLRAALERDGLDLNECDVRIQGSSARFFSGSHKQMPTGRSDFIDLFVEVRKRY